MNLFIIHEIDFSTDEKDVIGVCDSVENAESLIRRYYGEYREIHFKYIRDSTLEYTKRLEVKDWQGSIYVVEITLQWFTLNEI